MNQYPERIDMSARPNVAAASTARSLAPPPNTNTRPPSPKSAGRRVTLSTGERRDYACTNARASPLPTQPAPTMHMRPDTAMTTSPRAWPQPNGANSCWTPHWRSSTASSPTRTTSLRDLLRRESERALAQVTAVLPNDIANADPVETFTTRWFLCDQPDAENIDVDLLAHLLLTAMQEGGRLVLNDPNTYPPERLTAMARFMVETFFNRAH
jgi:hypothetical protein